MRCLLLLVEMHAGVGPDLRSVCLLRCDLEHIYMRLCLNVLLLLTTVVGKEGTKSSDLGDDASRKLVMQGKSDLIQ